jgi:hypothetical protein
MIPGWEEVSETAKRTGPKGFVLLHGGTVPPWECTHPLQRGSLATFLAERYISSIVFG